MITSLDRAHSLLMIGFVSLITGCASAPRIRISEYAPPHVDERKRLQMAIEIDDDTYVASHIRKAAEANAAVMEDDFLNWTPLDYAAIHGSTRCARYLLSIGADPFRRSLVTGETPLHIAVETGNTAVARLLAAGAEQDRSRSPESQIWLDAMHGVVAVGTEKGRTYYVDLPDASLKHALTNELAYLDRNLVPLPSESVNRSPGRTIHVNVSMETTRKALVQAKVLVLPGVGWGCDGEARRVNNLWIFITKSSVDYF